MEKWIDPVMSLPALLPSYDSCYVCGQENPRGLHIRFFAYPDREVGAEFEPGEGFAGYDDIVHGGVISAFLDELTGWAVSLPHGLLAYTAELTVRFVAPVLRGKRHVGRARMGEGRGRLWQSQGLLSDEEGRVCARSSGKYILLSPTQTAELAARMTWHHGAHRDAPVQ
jgi:acyl-coenzyme A thioesterase PaaI-like protein